MLWKHVFLIGMPGSGKSSLGRRTAKETGLQFADMDEMIEKAAGMSVTEFFSAHGEEAFRQAETNLLCWLTRAKPMIISTGGGSVMREENRKIMRNWGSVIWVDRPPEEIAGDLRTENRPLLKDGGIEKLQALYAERMPVYREAADYTLNNNQGYMPALYALIRILKDRLGA